MNQTVLCWLKQTAEKHPDKTAFIDENGEITFSEIDSTARSIGTFLATKTQPGKPIIVMSGRHTKTPAIFLGIVYAGCFYCPIDATMPVARLNQIIDVTQSAIMIVDRDAQKIAESLCFEGEIFVVDDIEATPADDKLIAAHSNTLLPTSPLYVIFTSGSTGVPKGVITSHLSLMNYINAIGNVLDINEADVIGSQSPFDYIAAIRDIYFPIKNGATTVIIPKKDFSMPVQLFSTLNQHKVTTLCWSSAGIELPAKLGGFSCGKPEYLKKVCFSGSVLPSKYLKIWQENLPDALFVNQYGPTEATASCTYYIVNEKVTDSTVLPIGKPYDNYGILLLNEDNSQTQHGEIGEICVTGPVLALGYYNDINRTNESFIQNPLNNSYRELIYKTGDLGRFRDDGNLEFHGRKDRQIKHMGHRIELNEIEAVAKQIDGISDCCALYDKEASLLYLFYTGNCTAKEIAIYFRKTLPAFMVPRKTVQLESLPLLPNGKLDMQALKLYFQN